MLAGCKEERTAQAPPVRVRTMVVQPVEFAPAITLTGVVAAQTQTELSFRVSGKVRERLANVGEHVTADQVLARLDPSEQEADVETAIAGVQSAEAVTRQVVEAFERQKNLFGKGNTTRRDLDQAEAAQRSAQAQLDQARAQLLSARDQLGYTELRAGADGVIVGRSIETGQVVAQAQPAYVLARDGARDGVFNVHEWALANLDFDKGLDVSLVSDPAVATRGRVREISPAVDANSMTVTVKVGLERTPPAMTLGTLVNGAGPMRQRKVFLVPWGAMSEIDGAPALWIVDPASKVVSLKPVRIDRYSLDRIAVTGEIAPGQTIVVAGGQTLRPGQKVEPVAEARP